ncbi:MAG: TAXI family TRAP transporter solute-binding subunit [Azovibrio sp.]
MAKQVQLWWVAFREWLITAWPLVLIIGVGFWVAFQFVQPSPPRHLVLTTGGEDGAYYAFAARYKEIFARNGIELEILTSKGSAENLQRLQDGTAQIGFIQGGSLQGDEDIEDLSSIGSAFYEPIWVFVQGKKLPDRLTELEGWRIAIGQEGSGVRALASRLLEANELDSRHQPLISVGGLEAAEELQQGRLDALFVIAAPEAPIVQVLLRSPGIRVMSFSQAEAYRRMFPFLFRLVLPEGGVDLVRNYPRHDKQLLTATANLVVRDDLHPALVTLMLSALREVHGGSGFFQAKDEFPAYKDTTFPLSEQAARFYRSGPPWLQQYLPFWVAVLTDRFLVLVLPLFALVFPLARFAPALYSWRIRSKVYRSYGELKFLENDIRQHYSKERSAEFQRRLDEIEEVANGLAIPLAFSDLLYTLREHVDLVRKILNRFDKGEVVVKQEVEEASS